MSRRLDSLRARLRSLFHRHRADNELDEELRYHIESQTERNVAAGMAPGEARYAALREFGQVAGVKEECRETRGVHLIEDLLRDIRFGARNLLQQPLLVVTAAVSLGLGIGVTTVVYSLFQELVLTPPTAKEPHRVVQFRMGNGSHASYAEYRDLSESGALDGIAGYFMGVRVNLRVEQTTTAVYPMFVTANYFDVLGVAPAQGRLFAATEAAPEMDPRLVVISYSLWQTRFSGDPAAMGQTLLINGLPHTILGVLPRDTRSMTGYGVSPEVYLPLTRALLPNLDRSRGLVELVGRLKPDMTVRQARAALTVAGRRLESTYPIERKGFGEVGRILRLDDPARLSFFPVLPTFALLFAVVGFVYLIACANLAGLLLARGAARHRETAIRAALGASRRRLAQHFLAEGFLLASLGTLLALALNVALTQALNNVTMPVPIPILLHMGPDARLLAIGFLLALATTLLGGLAPALQTTKPRLTLALKRGDRRIGLSRLTWRKVLVAGQVAISFVLLVTAMLFVRNLRLATETNPGFEVDPLVWAETFLLPDLDGGAQPRGGAIDRVLAELRALPGVVSAAGASLVPLTHDSRTVYGAIDIPGVESNLYVERSVNSVTPQYFATMGIEITRGRDFDEHDADNSDERLIVNETFVDRYLQGRVPVGQTIVLDTQAGRSTARIVGVVRKSKYKSLGEEDLSAFYSPLRRDRVGASFLVRSDRPAVTMLRAIDQAIKKQEPLAAVRVETMRQGLAFAFLPSRFGMAFLGSFGLLGLSLAMVGLYGMLAYSVSRRTSEIGVRMALGATRRDVVTMALRESLAVVGVGMLIGAALSLLATPALGRFLAAGLEPNDPLSLAATAVLLMTAALAASFWPARRAARVDPMAALRHE